MNNKRKSYIINNEEVVVEAENALYSGVSGTYNVAGALDSIKGKLEDVDEQLTDIDTRIDALENPAEPIVAEYTEADATVIGKYVYTSGTEVTNDNYKCSPHILLPVSVRMFVKTDYAFTGMLNLLFSKAVNQQTPIRTITSGGPYAEWTEVLIPDLAEYFRFNLTNDTTKHITIKFVSSPSIDSPVKLKVASWNVEGWDEPRSQMSIAEMRNAFRDVFDRVNADIICFSEFRKLFDLNDNPTLASKEILGNYPYQRIGAEGGSYNFNVVVSKLPIVDSRVIWFNTITNGQHRYFREARIRINGKEVIIAAAHFDFQDETYQTEYQKSQHYEEQFKQIVLRYANYPYVIIGADFNVHKWDKNGVHKYISPGVSDPDEVYISSPGDENYGNDGYLNYQYFIDAGYTLMNFDYLNIVNPKDYDANNPYTIGAHTADNIAVKGFAMGKREYVDTGNLSDHLMVTCELVML